ncbi:MAG: pseudouridine synthase, partial [candidate division WOR-3 bacterium]
MKVRIDKLLSTLGYGSRKEVRNLIKSGLVKVDDITVRDPSVKIIPGVNRVIVDGTEASNTLDYRYYKMYKPKGVITSTKDRETTLFDLISHLPRVDRLFPVGRLDKDAEGLVLITDNGFLAHRLTHPKWHVEKVYIVTLQEPLAENELQILKVGVPLKDGTAKATQVESYDKGYKIKIAITEGRYHIIKRMFEYLG